MHPRYKSHNTFPHQDLASNGCIDGDGFELPISLCNVPRLFNTILHCHSIPPFHFSQNQTSYLRPWLSSVRQPAHSFSSSSSSSSGLVSPTTDQVVVRWFMILTTVARKPTPLSLLPRDQAAAAATATSFITNKAWWRVTNVVSILVIMDIIMRKNMASELDGHQYIVIKKMIGFG